MTFLIENVGQMFNNTVTKPLFCSEQQLRGGNRPLKLKLTSKKSHLYTSTNDKSYSTIILSSSSKKTNDENIKLENNHDLFLPLFDGQLTEYLEKIYSQNSLNMIINDKIKNVNLSESDLIHDLKALDQQINENNIEINEIRKNQNTEYYLNLGKAVETIRNEFPLLFQQDLTYDIYRDDIVFRDPLNKFQGLKFYKYMFLSLRWHARILFKSIHVEIRNIWLAQEGIIRVRWTVYGMPRIPWEAEGIFDGVSTYKLDSKGKIYEHAVDNIIFRDPPMFKLPVLFTVLSRTTIATRPTPGIWCSKIIEKTSYMLSHFSWIRMYCALYVASQLYSTSSVMIYG